jgi:APA family basic amino acid/polyamine antiporter
MAVAVSVLVLRYTDRERHRPFRTPLVPFVPIGGFLICGGLLLLIPLSTWAVYGIWVTLGIAIYLGYGGRSAGRLRD